MKRTNVSDTSVSPSMRESDLVTREIPGELLVYDLKRHKAFCLNETAAMIWKGCNGKRTVEDLRGRLQKHLRTAVHVDLVWLALAQLEKSHLLITKTARPGSPSSISRRRLIRAGIAAGIALPLVTMISAPTAQAAGTPITAGVCVGRRQNNPGGCGGNPCSNVAGTTCKNFRANNCLCQN